MGGWYEIFSNCMDHWCLTKSNYIGGRSGSISNSMDGGLL